MFIDGGSTAVDEIGDHRERNLAASRAEMRRLMLAVSREAREQQTHLRSFVSRPSGGVVVVDGDHTHDECRIRHLSYSLLT